MEFPSKTKKTNLSEAANWLAEKLIIVMLAVMSVVIVVQVFARHFLSNALPWPEELARFLMIWIAMLGGSIAWRRGQHIGVTFLLERLPLYVANLLKKLWLIAIAIFLISLIYSGYEMAWFVRNQFSPALRISMFWGYAAIPTGALFILVQVLNTIIRHFHSSGACCGAVTTGRQEVRS